MQTAIQVVVWLGIAALTFGAWLQHVITCLHQEAWGILIAGAIMFPIGIIHGWLIWFGVM